MAYAAISGAHLVARSTNSNGFTSSSIDTTGGDTIFVVLSDIDGTPTLSDSKSNTYTQLTGASKVGSGPAVSIWYAKNAACGTGHTFTVTATTKYPSICVQVFSGGDISAPFDTGKESGATSLGTTIQPGSLTPSVDNCVLITGYGDDITSRTLSIDSSFTITDQAGLVGGQAYSVGMAYKIQTTAAAVNPTWTTTTSSNALRADMAAFKAAAAAAQDTPELRGRPGGLRGELQMRQLLAQ